MLSNTEKTILKYLVRDIADKFKRNLSGDLDMITQLQDMEETDVRERVVAFAKESLVALTQERDKYKNRVNQFNKKITFLNRYLEV